MEQTVLESTEGYKIIDQWLSVHHIQRVLLVCDSSILKLAVFEYLKKVTDRLDIKVNTFSDFQPNPLYENILEGVSCFRVNRCTAIIAVGGGSAIDVAKCIKLYSGMDGDGKNGDYLRKEIVPNSIPFLAIPTTSGTGSEATRYAVIYYNDTKQSITDDSCLPETVILDPSVLRTVPDYQRKATMMDALCHAIESFWSVNSTEESIQYSKAAIHDILAYMEEYLSNTEEGNAAMLRAANMAGKAINITQTTAGHAMCYKITSLFGCAHGHAAILCDRVLFPWMIDHVEQCIDPRGADYLKDILDQIAKAMGCENSAAAAGKLNDIFLMLGLKIPFATDEQFRVLKKSVNPVRLKNHPIFMDEKTIDALYHKILNGSKK